MKFPTDESTLYKVLLHWNQRVNEMPSECKISSREVTKWEEEIFSFFFFFFLKKTSYSFIESGKLFYTEGNTLILYKRALDFRYYLKTGRRRYFTRLRVHIVYDCSNVIVGTLCKHTSWRIICDRFGNWAAIHYRMINENSHRLLLLFFF